MPLYLIYMPGGTKQVDQGFPLRHTIAEDSLWAVGSDLLTAADVCQSLGMIPGQGGVVVKFDEYYGLHDVALWDKLRAWGRER